MSIQMKKYLLTFLSSLALLTASGAPFEVDGISYNVISSSPARCEVVSLSSDAELSDLAIPSTVISGGITYSVYAIGEYAFAGNSRLQSVSIPESVETIGRNAFQSCGSITSVIFPSTVKEIGTQTFYECSSLENFKGKGVVSIADNAFSGCASLSKLELSPALGFIGRGAFSGCTSLVYMNLPEGLEMSSGVFSGCASLESVSLPSSLRVIPEHTFNGCRSLRVVNGVSGITEVGDYAFYTCSSLSAIGFGDSLHKIGRSAFGFCSDLDISRIEGNGLVIGSFAFSGCESLQDVEFIGVEEIGEEAFANDDALKTISFDSGIRYIRERAFRNSDNILGIACMAVQPPFMANNSFDQTVYDKAVVTVPFGRSLLYKQTPPWGYFWDIEEAEDTGIEDKPMDEIAFNVAYEGGTLRVTGCEGLLNVADIAGRIIMSERKGSEDFSFRLPTPGVYVVTLGGHTEKIICN